ncbi:MAG: Fe-S cluster assembly ATPase SufC [Bacilli bacterium]
MKILEITNLNVEIENKKIFNDFNFNINENEISVIMGPNGTGKSTLSKVIMGDKNYKTKGKISLYEEDISNMEVYQRARKGIFLANQLPLEIDGITNIEFLKTSLASTTGENVPLYKFMKDVESYVDELGMKNEMISRYVNSGFSGGERKKNEILQMKILKPKLIILDEIDSGLDVDSLKIVCENIMDYYKNNTCSILIITHYNKLLEYIKPDKVNVLLNGKIVKTGDAKLALEVEQKGYEYLNEK